MSSSTVKIRERVPGQHKTCKMEKGRGKELHNRATLPQKSSGGGEIPAARHGSFPKELKGIQHSPHTLTAGKTGTARCCARKGPGAKSRHIKQRGTSCQRHAEVEKNNA